MKFLLLFMFVAVALAVQESKLRPNKMARDLASIFQIDPVDSLECVRTSKVRIEDLRYMKDVIDLGDNEVTNLESLKKASCVLVCCAQKREIMVGGVVQLEELFKFFQKIGIPEDLENQLRIIVGICKEQVTDTSDECMAGYKFLKCAYQRLQTIVQHK
ncbi:uncharacterized protein LOC143210201 isoform X3 [Lasioglossum baleicum]|uniref:uncharacterized protein LOC143210201 isoform X3 n=1 Tax=Lasioglossum baleicum TaxID=434251 RepID=UPI003FCC96D6